MGLLWVYCTFSIFQGISGIKQEGGAGAIERVLNMIPPPPVKESETEDDEEWED